MSSCSRWRPSAIFEFSKVENFNCGSHSEAQYASSYQISRRSVEPFQRYGRFSTFQYGGRRHLGFWKFQIFNGWDAQEGRTASACQILSKSLKPRLRYGDFSIFQHGGRPPSWIFESWKFQLPVPFWGPICVIVTNFVKIGRTVPEIWPIFDFSILDFGNFKFLTVGTLKRVELRLRAKFCRNRSNRGWDMAIFRFLANVNVLRYVCYMRSQFRLSSVCLSVVCCLWRWCTLLRRLNFSAIFFTIR